MDDSEINLLKQLEQDVKRLEAEQKALQDQIQWLLTANLDGTTALLKFLRYSHPHVETTQALRGSFSSLKELKTSIDRRLHNQGY